MDKIINITELTPGRLSSGGDRGNTLCLIKRLRDRGIEAVYKAVEAEEDADFSSSDIIILGGGSEKARRELLPLLKASGMGEKLRTAVMAGTVIFAVGAGFELLGESIISPDGETTSALSVLPFDTQEEKNRMTGNGVVFSEELGESIVGFFNHAGRSILHGGVSPLGLITEGSELMPEDKREGLRFKNAFCTYLRGPVLPKNPALADLIIKTAGERKYGEFTLEPLKDDEENNAHNALLRW